jgi:Ala-tRNA(Pro) deacylase
MNVQQFLKEHSVSFDVLEHRPTFDAQRMAQTLHVRGNEVAKSVVLHADDRYVLAVLPATHKVDFAKARELLGARNVALASEEDFGRIFPDCELGALPPFGSQYGLVTLVDEPLTKDEQIVFEGNNHHEAIRMSFAEFRELEKPKVGAFSYHV